VTTIDREWVYLVRHGQTVWNTQRRRQGQLDSPLTPEGLLHAERSADLVKAMGVDRVFSSPLGRARTTAAMIAARLALPVEVIEDLQEVHHGRIAGLSDLEIERDHPKVAADRARDKYRYRFPGGESYADADQRAEQALAQIRATRVRRPLIVAHEMIGRMLLRNLLDLDPQTSLSFSHPHGVIYRIQVDEHRADQIDAGGITPFWPASRLPASPGQTRRLP
jgi:broad specificity phosphatase PhoE